MCDAAPVIIAPTTDIAICRALRQTVFIEEQGVSEADEIDDLDHLAVHILALIDDLPIGCARLIINEPIGKIGRVCVLASHRGLGIGAALIRHSVDHLRANPNLRIARLGAQTHAIQFYEKLGFVAHGPVYDDACIAHRDMDYSL